jgi:hypothetical protein
MVELVRGFFKEQKQNLAWIGQIFLYTPVNGYEIVHSSSHDRAINFHKYIPDDELELSTIRPLVKGGILHIKALRHHLQAGDILLHHLIHRLPHGSFRIEHADPLTCRIG